MRYKGTVSHARGIFGWIALASVTKEDGSPHDLATDKDIYLHHKDSNAPVRKGLEVMFDVGPDAKRGEGTYRASVAQETDANRIERLGREGMFDLPNVGLRFLFDSNEAQTSAVLRLQWCIDIDAMEWLRKHQVGEPLLIITATSPSGREDRQLVPLSQMQVMLQFHRSGIHKIHGRIIWGVDMKAAKKKFLHFYNRGDYDEPLDNIKSYKRALGNAELDIDVPPDFFAKELSAWHQWWLALWLGELWDECNMRRRFAFAYLIQGPLVLIWVVFNCLCRFIVAGTLSGLLLQRKVRWEAVLRPFEYEFEWVWASDYYYERSRTDRKIGSLIRFDKDGNRRPVDTRWAWLLFPPIHVVLLLIAVVYAFFSGEFNPLTIVKAYAVSFASLIGIVFAIGVIVVVDIVVGLVGTLWGSLPSFRRERREETPKEPSQFFLWLLRNGSDLWNWMYGPIREHNEQQRLLAYQREQEERKRFYEELACTNAPEQGIRPVSAMTFSITRVPRLLYQNLKSKVCKPIARG